MAISKCPYPPIIAHRGGGSLAPENTLVAIDYGHQLGHRMIEFDAKLSADGQIFLLHDDTLNRTTSQQGIAGELPWHKLQNLDAGSWFASQFNDQRLPTLEQVAERCSRYKMWANIEIKPTIGQERLTGEKVALAAKKLWPASQPPLLSSFSIIALEAAHHAAPNLPVGWLIDEWHNDWHTVTQRLGCWALHVNYRLLTAKRIAAVKQQGLYILAYTVNQPQTARWLLQHGVDMICTDRIDLISPDFFQRKKIRVLND